MYPSLTKTVNEESSSSHEFTPKMKEKKEKKLMEYSKSSEAERNEYVLNVAFFSFLLFMIVQGFVSIIAKSQAMWADTMAMSIDALTYLFNLVAERLKHLQQTNHMIQYFCTNTTSSNSSSSSSNSKRTKLSDEELTMKRKELRLYLEFIIPVVSVTALIIVSAQTFIEAVKTIRETLLIQSSSSISSKSDTEVEPNVNLMLFFSGLNLLLDIMNVTCFAKATNFTLVGGTLGNTSSGRVVIQQGEDDVEDETEQLSLDESSHHENNNNNNNKIRIDVEMNFCNESEYLLSKDQGKCLTCDYGSETCNIGESDSYLSFENNNSNNYNNGNSQHHQQDEIINDDCLSEGSYSSQDSDDISDDAVSENSAQLLNLNMCSAYTHVMADTFRSIAVLIAAGIARIFDGIDPSIADASASIVVSFIIAISLGPLILGLLETLKEIAAIRRSKVNNKCVLDEEDEEDMTQPVFLEEFQSLPHGIYNL